MALPAFTIGRIWGRGHAHRGDASRQAIDHLPCVQLELERVVRPVPLEDGAVIEGGRVAHAHHRAPLWRQSPSWRRSQHALPHSSVRGDQHLLRLHGAAAHGGAPRAGGRSRRRAQGRPADQGLRGHQQRADEAADRHRDAPSGGYAANSEVLEFTTGSHSTRPLVAPPVSMNIVGHSSGAAVRLRNAKADSGRARGARGEVAEKF